MAKSLVEALIAEHEGRKSKRYIDTAGIATIGIGHNLQVPVCAEAQALQVQAGLPIDDDWTDATIDAQFAHDLPANASFLEQRPWWAAVGEARRAALQDMAFNLGPDRAAKFTTFYGLVATGDWKAAAADLLSNTQFKPGHPLHQRYQNLADILVSGSCSVGDFHVVDR